ncbi:hypothetical protein LCGC14_2840780 [marine sediment metagenome]|uniref:Uncharacterized protein n=1 Tax=marine sediment metagenome TaxID=412755 RepID=A0A0F9B2D6_9ZZZZ
MKKFRIVHLKKGFIDLYQSQVKTWFGWRSFSAHNDGSIYFLHNPTLYKQDCFDRIECYRMAKGLPKAKIVMVDQAK